MAGMTVVAREASYLSLNQNNGVVTKTATGAGSDATVIVAAATSTQQHIITGCVSFEAAGSMSILSGSTEIGTVELAAAGTAALPPLYTSAGSALVMTNTDGISTFVSVEVAPVVKGQHLGL